MLPQPYFSCALEAPWVLPPTTLLYTSNISEEIWIRNNFEGAGFCWRVLLQETNLVRKNVLVLLVSNGELSNHSDISFQCGPNVRISNVQKCCFAPLPLVLFLNDSIYVMAIKYLVSGYIFFFVCVCVNSGQKVKTLSVQFLLMLLYENISEIRLHSSVQIFILNWHGKWLFKYWALIKCHIFFFTRFLH